MTARNSQQLPLEGIRIADFGWMIAGTLGTRTLANLGAEVIRIESRARVDGIRFGGPLPNDRTNPNVSGLFNDCNLSKLSVSLNLNHPEAVELARRIVAISDAVTCNFTGTRMDRWGLGYSDLVKVKPDVIVLMMPTMGTTGPHRDYRSMGNHVAALVGINVATGFPGRPPVGPDIAYPDFSSNPNHAAFALLSAIHYRNRTGRGQFIDVSQYESTASLTGPTVLEYSATGRIPEPSGNSDPDLAPHGVFRCADDVKRPDFARERWVALVVDGDDEWSGFKRAAGNPVWAEDERFATAAGRLNGEAALNERIQDWVRNKDAYAVATLLQAHGIAAGVVQDTRDLIENDAHWAGRQLRSVTNPEAGEYHTHAEPSKFRGVDQRLIRAPSLGEHTDYVLGELLGVPEEEINRLVLAGAID
jgi:benzylsuccinate CoA-transferase BbsF subunit